MPFSHRNLRELVIYLCLIGVVAVLFAGLARGEFQEVKVSDVNAVAPSSLIDVHGDLNFDHVLPGHPYERTLKVSLNLMPSMLAGLRASNVMVYVKAYTDRGEDSSLFFTADNGKPVKVVRFSLVCIVVNSTCSEGSQMENEFIVSLNVPSSEYPYTDQVIVNASLQPLPFEGVETASLDIYRSVTVLENQLNELRQSIGELGDSAVLAQNFSELERVIEETKAHASALDVQAANASLFDSRVKLNDLKRATENQAPTGYLTGQVFGYNFPLSFEHILLLAFGAIALSLYLYHRKGQKPGKPFDVSQAMQDVEKEK